MFTFLADQVGEYVQFNGRSVKNYQGGLKQTNVISKEQRHYARPGDPRCYVQLLKYYI